VSQPARAVSPRAGAVAVGAVALAFVLLVGGWLLGTHVRYVGSNSVAPRYPIPGVTPGHRICAKQLTVPGNANAIRIALTGSTVPAPVTLRLTAGGRTQVSHAQAPPGRYDTVFRFDALGHAAPATACVTTSGTVSSAAGMPLGGSGEGTAYLDGKPLGRLTIAYLHYPTRSLLSVLPAGARHAALFRAGFVHAWTYALLAALVLCGWAVGLRLMLRSSG
jgi:hypothetical protein